MNSGKHLYKLYFEENKEKLQDQDYLITTADLLNNKYILVQRGKKNYFLLLAE